MRIVIDMQGVQTVSRFRGIGRYTMSLVKAMLHNHPQHEYVLVLNGLLDNTIGLLRAEFDGLIAQKNIRVWEALGPVCEVNSENLVRHNVAQLLRESFIANLRPDLLLITTMFEGYHDEFVCSIGQFDTSIPTAIIFYDIIPYLYPENYFPQRSKLHWYKNRIAQSKRADLFLCISESTKRDIIEHLEIHPEKTVNISAASDERFYVQNIQKEEKEALLSQYGLKKPYLIYLSTSDEHKNHKRLLQAFAKLPEFVRNQHQICFAGTLTLYNREDFFRFATSYGLNRDDLIITGHLADEEINKLMNLSQAFICPSLHEGFGLPVLEAMCCGCAVIGSNTGSLPEIIGRKEALFNPFDVNDMCQRIAQILTNHAFRKRLKKHSLRQVKNFSWDKSAKITIDAIVSLGRESRHSLADKKMIYPEGRSNCLIQRIAALSSTYDDEELIKIAAIITQNEFKNSKPRLIVDISELVQRDSKTGIQRVVRNILRQWLLNPPQDMLIEPVYASFSHGYKYAKSFVKKLTKQPDMLVSDEFIEFGPGDIFISLDLVPVEVIFKHQKFYESLRKHGVIVKFILYDLLPIQFPKYFQNEMLESYRQWLNVACQSDGLICISKAVANELTKYLNQCSQEMNRRINIDWFHLGSELDDIAPQENILKGELKVLTTIKQRLSFLVVGTIEPRKAHEQILDAFEELWASGLNINLVIAGKQGWKMEKFIKRLHNHSELGKYLFLLEGPSDYYLDKVYTASTCLIAASEGEGFGLPLIEAANYKIPIIARNLPVFREVAGKHAFYFENSKDPQVIVKAVEHWLELNANGRAPQSEKMPRLTWAESAQWLLKIAIE